MKIICSYIYKNHILRNYLNRIVDIATHRKSSSGTVVPGFLWKVLKDKRLKLRYVYALYLSYIISLL